MPATEYILWGYKPDHGFPFDTPLKLTGGNVGHCRAEKRMYEGAPGFKCAIYRKYDAPVALRLQAEADQS